MKERKLCESQVRFALHDQVILAPPINIKLGVLSPAGSEETKAITLVLTMV
jgi:hypothetical protein